ncbi:MAG: HAD-IB family hydrolase [Thermoleophilia bacterium]|nr:HAD-IB family hydrolase [Thermoleophilia bacterium]
MNDAADNASIKPGASSESGERPAAEAKAPAAAFFDLDGTLVVGQTTLLLVKFLRKAGVAGWAFLIGTGLWFLGYKAGFYKVTADAREKGAHVFRGLTVSEVEQLMTRFTDEVLMARLHPAASAALAEHRAEGDRVVVVSAALEPVVKALCAKLDVADYVGTGCQLEEGRYTGRLEGAIPIDEEKASIAAEFMAHWGVRAEDCWAYADHGSDLALLGSVGHPVAVSPRPALLEAAQAAGWPILR